MATFQQQISSSYDDTYCSAAAYSNAYAAAFARFGFYVLGKSGARYDAFLRFLLNIPVGATINSAIITLVAYASRTDDFISQINFTNEDDAAQFYGGGDYDPWNRADGGTNVAWPVPDFVAEQQVQTVDISSLIQAFINLPDYKANNHIAIRIKNGDAASGEYQWFYQYDGDSTKAAILTVEYTLPVVWGGDTHHIQMVKAILGL